MRSGGRPARRVVYCPRARTAAPGAGALASPPKSRRRSREDCRPMTQPTPTPPSAAVAPEQIAWLKRFIRDIPDYPQPGVLFRDITPLLQNAEALHVAIETMARRYRGAKID